MEKKKKKDSSKPNQSSLQAEANEPLSKEEQAQSGANFARKNAKTSCPSNDSVTVAAQQCAPVLQWPCATQHVQKPSPFISRPSAPSQQPPMALPNQWRPSSINPQQTPQQQQQHPTIPAQQSSLPSDLTQPSNSLWLPPGPGFMPLGANMTQPFARADSNWQTFIGAGAGPASVRPEQQIPGLHYQGGHSQPMAFPGTWNPSAWWGQSQQPHPPCAAYNFPGAYGFYPFPPPPVSESSLLFGQNHQRGIIRTEENLSRKHQKMWEAQSLENIQLWAVIGQLRADLAVYGSRIMKLEAEVSSLKPSVELSTGATAGTGSGVALVRQTSKRGRPKKVAPTTVLPYADESQPQADAKRHAPNKAHTETKGLNLLKESRDFDNEQSGQSDVGKSKTRHETDGNHSNGMKSNSNVPDINACNLKIPQATQVASTSHNQIRSDIPRSQSNLNLLSAVQCKDRSSTDQTATFSVSCEPLKGAEVDSTSAMYKGTIDSGNHGWGSNNFQNNRPQTFYNSVHLIRQEGKVVPGWSFMNESATDEHEDVVMESGKDDNEEELEDASSGADVTTRAKVGGSYEMNSSGSTKFWLN